MGLTLELRGTLYHLPYKSMSGGVTSIAIMLGTLLRNSVRRIAGIKWLKNAASNRIPFFSSVRTRERMLSPPLRVQFQEMGGTRAISSFGSESMSNHVDSKSSRAP